MTRKIGNGLRHTTIATAIAIAMMIGSLSAQSAQAADMADAKAMGKKLYNQNCSTCHGENADGNGILAPFLTVQPKDLVTIKEQNDGQFPFLKVFQIIDGRTLVPLHGGNEMPVWGSAFTEEREGIYGVYGSEPFVRARIVALTEYLQSIQK